MSHIVRIISEKQMAPHKEYRREFQLIGEEPGAGYSFPCDADGNVNVDDKFYKHWKDNYTYCLSHPDLFEDLGCVEGIYYITVPAVALCSCGREILLGAHRHCECGQLYTQWGQKVLTMEDFYM